MANKLSICAYTSILQFNLFYLGLLGFILTYYFEYVTNAKNLGDECKSYRTTLESSKTGNSASFETTSITLNSFNMNSDKITFTDEKVSKLLDIQDYTYFTETKKSPMDVTSKERTGKNIIQHLTTVFEKTFYETSSKIAIFNQVTQKAETSSGLITLNLLVASIQPGQIPYFLA